VDWKRLVQFALLGSSDLEQYAILSFFGLRARARVTRLFLSNFWVSLAEDAYCF
jgi:hypothetical protein